LEYNILIVQHCTWWHRIVPYNIFYNILRKSTGAHYIKYCTTFLTTFYARVLCF
jgi:hypothetical protein